MTVIIIEQTFSVIITNHSISKVSFINFLIEQTNRQ